MLVSHADRVLKKTTVRVPQRVGSWVIAVVSGVLAGWIMYWIAGTPTSSMSIGVLVWLVVLGGVELRQPQPWWLRTLMLVGALCLIGGLYTQGYPAIPGDDGTPAMTMARFLAMNEQADFDNPIYPELHTPAYDSFVAAEFPLHVVLASVYQLMPDDWSILRVSNGVMLSIFLLSLWSVYVCVKGLSGKDDLALVTVSLLGVTAFYGRAFWGAHYAQMLGMVILPLCILLLHRLWEMWSWKQALLCILIVLALYPVHILTWIVASILYVVVLCAALYKQYRWWGIAAIGVFGFGVVGTLFLLSFEPGIASAILPVVPVEFAYSQMPSFFRANFVVLVVLPLVLFGAIHMCRRGPLLVVLWFFVTWVLTQSTVLQLPFYSVRFDEYVIVPLVICLAVGIGLVLSWIHRPVQYAAVLAALIVILIPTVFSKNLTIADSYLNYTSPYHPSTIPADDISAFVWLEEYAPAGSLVIDVEKFGRYIPIVSGHFRSSRGLEVYTAPSVQERWVVAHAVGADYVVWDAVFTQVGETYPPFLGYTEQFSDPLYFSLVYENATVRIYEVL